MNKRLAEEAVLLIAAAKWFILATVVGVLVGLSTTLFLKLLHAVIDILSGVPYAIGLLPIALLISAWITSSLAPEAGGQGIERVIQAVHLRSGKIDAQVIPTKMIATILTIGAGGSAGNVGPCAQIGGGLSSLFADIFKFNDADRKTLVISGISAGFASVLGTPLAGAFFGLEVLFIGFLSYEVLFPSVIAAIVGHQVAVAMGITYWDVFLPAVPAVTGRLFLLVALAGVFFGLCGVLLIECTNLGKQLAVRSKLRPWIHGALGGFALVGLALAFSPQFLGLGDQVLQDTIRGQEVIWYAFLLKILATSITLNFGGSGGIIMPICFIGTMAGAWFGTLFHLDSGLFAALGLVGLLAGAANTPLAAIVLALELFGLKVGIYALVVCAISFLICGHRSAIPTQLVRLSKAPAIYVELNQEISQVQPTVELERKNLKTVVQMIMSRLFSRKKES